MVGPWESLHPDMRTTFPQLDARGAEKVESVERGSRVTACFSRAGIPEELADADT